MSLSDKDSDSRPTERGRAPTLPDHTPPNSLPLSRSDLSSDLSDSFPEAPSDMSSDSSPDIPMDLVNLALPIPDLIQDAVEQVIVDVKQGPTPSSGFSPRLGYRTGKTGFHQ